MHPFAELTNKTPSPSAKKDEFGRKHSPWTAARHKKKTRSVDAQQQQEQEQSVGELPVYQQAIPEAYESPTGRERSAGANPVHSPAEYSLTHGLSPCSSASASPHSSPPVKKGSAEGAELHPSKAYLRDPEACVSPSGMDFGSAGGVDLAAAAAGRARGSSRSPVWFCSSTELQEGECEADVSTNEEHHSSSAPASGNLFGRFDQVARQQQQQQLPPLPQQPQQPQQQLHNIPEQLLAQQQCHVGRQGGPATRGRRLTARRGGNGNGGASSSSNVRQQEQQQQHLEQQGCAIQPLTDRQTAAAAAAASTATAAPHAPVACPDSLDCGFQLHSRLSQVADTDTVQRRRSFGSCGLQQRLWCSEETRGGLGGAGLGGMTAAAWTGHAAAGSTGECADEGTCVWFEEQMQQAADEGDVACAQQLWTNLQAAGLTPSRRFMNTFLICCHYGGADPLAVQEAVRDMCAAADMEPDGFTAQLLASIDIGWQQLHWEDC